MPDILSIADHADMKEMYLKWASMSENGFFGEN